LKKFKNSHSFILENQHQDLKIALENMEIKEKALIRKEEELKKLNTILKNKNEEICQLQNALK
jgi:hypothetical protein